MTSQPLDAGLSLRLDELDDKNGAPTSWLEVRDVVQSILTSMDGDFRREDVKLFAEVEALAQFIRSAKSEIAALCPEQLGTDHILTATDELDAVVSATEEATNAIMEAAETIEEVAERLHDEAANPLTAATTKIYEACSFQDITGQRIAKVVAALKEIEIKVEAIVATFDDDHERAEQRRRRAAENAGAPEAEGSTATGETLHGPQLPEQANNQDDIDALFD